MVRQVEMLVAVCGHRAQGVEQGGFAVGQRSEHFIDGGPDGRFRRMHEDCRQGGGAEDQCKAGQKGTAAS